MASAQPRTHAGLEARDRLDHSAEMPLTTASFHVRRNLPPPPRTMADDAKKMIKIQSSDGEEFELEQPVAEMSQLIKQLIKDGNPEDTVKVPEVKGEVLSKVLKYCKKHAESIHPFLLMEWDESFVNVNLPTLYDLITASDFLGVESLLILTCRRVADIIKGKSVDEIRRTFNITNDFSPEEEADVRKENQWDMEY